MKSLSLGQPHAIVMVGIPGSGKSFFAEKFADTFSAPYIELAYFRHFTGDEKAADDLVRRIIKEVAKTKQSMVLEVDSAARNSRTELAKELKTLGYVPLFIWVQTDIHTAAARSAKAYNMPKSEHAQHVKSFSPPHETEKALVISGKHTYATQARIVLKRLSGPRKELEAHRGVPERTATTIVVR